MSHSKKRNPERQFSPSYQRHSANTSTRHSIILRHCFFTVRFHYLPFSLSFPPLPSFFIFLVVHCCRRLRLHLPLPPPFKIINPTWKTHATPTATLRELIPTPKIRKVIFIWLLSLLHPPHIQNLHSKRVKAFKLIYLADPKRSVTTTMQTRRICRWNGSMTHTNHHCYKPNWYNGNNGGRKRE
jgi:hypothetical protein